MKIALQFAMPSELHALPGARELAPLETVSGVPIFEIAPDILACAGGVSKVNAAMAAELLCLRYGVEIKKIKGKQWKKSYFIMHCLSSCASTT